MTRGGDNVIVTDRGTPVAILHSFDQIVDSAGIDERLVTLAKRGMIRLPIKQGKLSAFKGIDTTGKPASGIIIEERR